MILRVLTVVCAFCVVACSQHQRQNPYVDLVLDDIQSGYVFLTEEAQALQDDTFSNPGYLWVDTGERLFSEGTPSCLSCHSDKLEGVATQYPKLDSDTSSLINLEAQINNCRRTRQSQPPFEYEAEELLALTAYVANQSKEQPLEREFSAEEMKHANIGKEYFFKRRGQLNLSCHQCHDRNWGKKLRGDTISQGHVNGFPAYRFEWQAVGSSHRRFRDCDAGVRAEPLPYGSQTYIALELYLTLRGRGLKVETPAIRR